MILERIKSAGISHNSYLIGAGSDAAVIDPRRDCQVYVNHARQRGLRIKYIFETHRNEDFVIGSVELKNITGAEIYHGPGLDWEYGNTLTEGQVFRMGDTRLTTLHTPGHTGESMSYALADLATGETPVAVFTGDTLFVGDVGRTDLHGPAEAPRLAADLYDSIVGKLLPLGDGVIILPAHGGGSVCGAHIADREESTIGIEKTRNRALQLKSKDAFVKYKMAEKLEVPPYFKQMAKYNLEGPPLRGRLPWPPPLKPREFLTEMEKGAIVVDASDPAAFGGVHIKGSYSLWLEGLPNFAGWLLPYDKQVLLVLEAPSHLDRAVRYLFRAGYERITGYLKGGIEAWYSSGLPVESMNLISVHQLKRALEQGEEMLILDVRGDEEWESGHLPGAKHIFVGHLEQRLSEVPKGKPVVAYCESGHRSGIAASILLRTGYPRVSNVPGSITAWKAAGFPIVKG